jgi:hypothetical protein
MITSTRLANSVKNPLSTSLNIAKNDCQYQKINCQKTPGLSYSRAFGGLNYKIPPKETRNRTVRKSNLPTSHLHEDINTNPDPKDRFCD